MGNASRPLPSPLLGSSSGIDAGVFISSLILSGEHTAFIATWFVIGGLLALGVFAISVISAVPLMLDHDADVPTAIRPACAPSPPTLARCCCGRPCSSA